MQFETRSLPALSPALAAFTLITRSPRRPCASYPSCVAVYPRASPKAEHANPRTNPKTSCRILVHGSRVASPRTLWSALCPGKNCECCEHGKQQPLVHRKPLTRDG